MLLAVAVIPLVAGFLSEWSGCFFFASLLVGAAGMLLFLPVGLDFGQSFHPLRMLAASTAASYGLGGAVSWFYAQTGVVGGFGLVLEDYGVRVSDLCLAMIAVCVFSLALMGFVWGRDTARSELSFARRLALLAGARESGPFLLWSMALVAMFQAVYMLNGSVGYKTYATSDVLESDIVLVVTAAQVTPFLCGILFARWRRGLLTHSAKWILIAALAVCVIWFVTRGRGPLLVACVTGLLGFSAVQPVRVRRLISFVLLVLLPVMVAASLLAQTIRLFQMVDESTRENVFSALSVAGREIMKFSGDEKRDARESQMMNLASRPLYANYPAQLIRIWRDQGVSILGFEEIFNSVKIAIPRRLYPNKEGIPLNETLYMLRLGMPGTDNAENVMMSSLVSLAFVGPIVWPLLVWLFFRLCTLGMRASGSNIAALVGTAWVICLTLSGGEGDLPSFIVTARNAVLLGVLAIPIEFFMKNFFPIPAMLVPRGKEMGLVRLPTNQRAPRR